MPSRSGLLDRVEIVAHAVDAAAGGRDDIVEIRWELGTRDRWQQLENPAR
jgi:hypothetical protein